MDDLDALIRALPKTDLHCHLDGSLRLETVLDLAAERGVALPAHEPERLGRALHRGELCTSLEHYLGAFEVTLAVLQDEPAIRRAARELVEDAAAEGIWYLEVRFSPVLHGQRGLSTEDALRAVLAGLAEGEAAQAAAGRAPIRAAVIVCGLRHLAPVATVALAELAVAYRRRGVCAFDLAGGEAGFPAVVHQEAFRVAREGELSRTVHAGEGAGAESIREALYACGAQRIGHGCRLYEDPSLLAYVTDHRIPLEVCPSSNEQTRAVAALSAHPLRDYVAQGVVVTINTDNRLMSDTTVTRELGRVVRECGVDRELLPRLVLDGFAAAFLPWREKAALIERAADEVDRLWRRT
jgi:adenosine deaminase